MPKSRHTSLMPSPSRRRATKRRRSCVTEHSFHGINTSRQMAKSVTHVSGTVSHLCLRPPKGPWAVHALGTGLRAPSLDGGRAHGDVGRANESPAGTGAPRKSDIHDWRD